MTTCVRSRCGRNARHAAGWILLPVLALALLGCDRDPTGRDGSLRASEFIDIIVELRTAEREVSQEVPPDSVDDVFSRRRDEILDRHGATEDDLRDFIERHHARPGLMSEVWDSITHRLTIRPEDTVEDLPVHENVW